MAQQRTGDAPREAMCSEYGEQIQALLDLENDSLPHPWRAWPTGGVRPAAAESARADRAQQCAAGRQRCSAAPWLGKRVADARAAPHPQRKRHAPDAVA